MIVNGHHCLMWMNVQVHLIYELFFYELISELIWIKMDMIVFEVLERVIKNNWEESLCVCAFLQACTYVRFEVSGCGFINMDVCMWSKGCSGVPMLLPCLCPTSRDHHPPTPTLQDTNQSLPICSTQTMSQHTHTHNHSLTKIMRLTDASWLD